MIIDAHQHVFWHKKNDADLVADLDAQGIDKAWLLTWEIPPTEDAIHYVPAFNPLHMRPDGTHPGLPFADAYAAARKYPERFILGYCPDPNIEQAPQWFENAVKMHGVRICGEWKYRMLVDDPRNIELFRKAGELNCPAVLHFDAPYIMGKESGRMEYFRLWYGGTMDNLESVLKACPQTTFLGHGPGFWREISGDAASNPDIYPKGPVAPGGKVTQLLEKFDNLYCDLSAGSGCMALTRDPEHARNFLTDFADRILFARDYYGSDLPDALKSFDLPADVQEKINFRNALKLVPL
ncbi:MAG: amidohydrolase family protein [Planctomycetes bacterium]|nr:amidohydrolase family protein [Planctomycetota bacterium]